MVYIKCKDAAAKVSDIIDQEANLFTRMRFYGHLMMCKKCRRYFEQFKQVKEAAGVVPPEDLPEDFDHVMKFVMREITKPKDNKDG